VRPGSKVTWYTNQVTRFARERTRARLHAAELANDLDPITVPAEPLDMSATCEQKCRQRQADVVGFTRRG